MTFARIKPDGWAVNEELTSAQQNALDIDHANAVDKTGDVITGNVHVGATGRITVDDTSKIVVLDGGTVEFQDGSLANFLTGASAVWGANSFLTVQAGGIATINNSALILGGTTTFTVGGSTTTTFNGAADFNGASTFDGATTFGANMTLNNSASMTVASSSGILAQGGASITWANTANASFQSGATATFQGGSFLAHASTSTDTYASGSLLEQVSGSLWDLKGTTTFTPTSIVYFSSGNSVGFASVPTFFAGFNATTAGTAAFAIPATFSSTVGVSGVATLSGSTTTISSATTTLSGASVTLSAANGRLKLTSRNVERKLCLAKADKLAFVYNLTNDSVAIGTGGHVAVDLEPPDGSTMSNVVVTWTGTGNITMNVMQNAVVIATLTTSSPGTHTLTTNCTALRDSTTYRLTFVENASNTPTLTVVKTNCLVTEYDEG